MKNFKLITLVTAATVMTNYAIAEAEITGKITHESASFIQSGTTTGAAKTHGGGDNFKSETSARFYVDGEIGDDAGSTYHAELQAYSNGEAVTDNKDNEEYTQRDALRELYVDTTYDDWSIRAGKQQVVWGTADGIKLLDMVNPTDYTEMAQNQMEDSRIPVFMLNGEKYLEDGGSFQAIISEPRENIFAGLNRNIDTGTRANATIDLSGGAATGSVTDYSKTGNSAWVKSTDKNHPFKLMGPDSITGDVNGFLNIVPDMGGVASQFGYQFQVSSDPLKNEGMHGMSGGLNTFTVGMFTGQSLEASNTAFSGALATLNFGGTAAYYGWDIDGDLADGTCTLASCTSGVETETQGSSALAAFTSGYDTNLYSPGDGKTDSAFEYMDRATFATFDTFAGAKSKYKYKMPSVSDGDLDYSMRYKNTTKSGVNYSMNYSYSYDKNPIINLYWENDAGNRIYQGLQPVTIGSIKTNTINLYDDIADTVGIGAYADVGQADGDYGAGDGASSAKKVSTLVFEQETKRIHNIGGSFDMAIDTESLGPVVIRGEALYMKDTYTPIINLGKLSYGDLPGALTMKKGDRFKYVIGADITAMTNMMVSLQFIQDRNLDYVDDHTDWDGTSCSSSTTANCGSYTTDYAAMHLNNGFVKSLRNKNFVSLFLSKPFGESDQHRWNNIIMTEQGGGRWNRFDVEYTIDDNTVATGEVNSYWGENDTQFGQLKKSSNVQLGVKYIF